MQIRQKFLQLSKPKGLEIRIQIDFMGMFILIHVLDLYNEI